ncbi:phosphoglycerate mutase family protein [Nissabacter sp. SGAir0207]|uniref:histidine phosphatase family protein n=1 Tax=Nissabacter sp. SGAir0207 TaxID=2126321 RepID=UPI001F0FC866|nr:phosphoglycerate mutase family protein [Nissabacter sp. SGAir0207]
MQEIMMMRHGKPALGELRPIAAGEMAQFIKHYNRADTGDDQPTEEGRRQAHRAAVIVSSDLPRALSSLRALGLHPSQTHAVFREAELPVLRLPAPRLAPFSWVFLFRLLWLGGWSGEAESYRAAQQRADAACDRLVALAQKADGPVLLMGHGIMNRLIAKRLMQRGWRQSAAPGKGHWGLGIYQSAP